MAHISCTHVRNAAMAPSCAHTASASMACPVQKAGAQKLILIRAAVAAARAWAAFLRVTPLPPAAAPLFKPVLKEALELLPCDEARLLRVRLPAAMRWLCGAVCGAHACL